MDRKTLIREYKETARPMGVYCVRNSTNGKILIGAANDLPARLNRHQAQLKMGLHPVKALQRDWNELGAEAFVFEVLDTLEPRDTPGYNPHEDLAELEAIWIEKLQPFEERGYHERPKSRLQA